MSRQIVEPVGDEVSKSGQLFAFYPTNNKPNVLGSLQLNRRVLAQVVQQVAHGG
jgi:hypothetical protein